MSAARRRRRRQVARTAATALLGVAALTLAACGGGTAAGSRAFAGGGTFTLAVPSQVPSFDPYATNAGSTQMATLAYVAYDSLINQSATGAYQTGIAQSWQVTPTKTTFTLRKGVTCSDGSPLTATQIASDLNYVGDPKNATPLLGVYTPTVPYQATGDNAAGTVTVTTSSPFAFTLQSLGNVPIVCAKGMADRSSLVDTSDGTGPFVLRSGNQTSFTFTVRKGYDWGPNGASTSAQGTPGTLVVTAVPDFTTAASQLLAGQLDAARINGPDVQRLTAARLSVSSVPYQKSGLNFNERPGSITSDVRVRQALTEALDFGQIAKVVSNSASNVATSLFAGAPVICPSSNAGRMLPPHDVAKANTQLDQAGWVRGPDGVRQKDGRKLALTFIYSTDEAALELIQQEWSAIGVRATLQDVTPQEAQDIYSNGTGSFDVAYGGYALPLPSSLTPYVSGPLPPKGYNYADVVNPTYDKLSAQAVATTGQAGCALWTRAQDALLQRVDIVPIANDKSRMFFSRNATATITSFRDPIPTTMRLYR
jgi:peptide/nickel transport system substrate-binding protein